MKIKNIAFISLLSITLLISCGGKSNSSSNNESNGHNDLSNSNTGSDITSQNVNNNSQVSNDTSSGGGDYYDTSEVSSESKQISSVLSNANFPISNGEGGMVSWTMNVSND